MTKSHNLKIYQGVDLIASKGKLNIGQKSKGDYFVRTTIGVDKLGFKYILNIHREQSLSFHQQIELIKEGGRNFNPELIVVEDNAAQTWISQELKKTTDLPIMSFTTTAKKRDVEEGIPSLALEFENGKIILPYGDERTKKIMDIFIQELTTYPLGKTDDMLMSFYLCMQGIKKRAKTHHVTKDLAIAMNDQIQIDSQLNIYEMIQKNQIL